MLFRFRRGKAGSRSCPGAGVLLGGGRLVLLHAFGQFLQAFVHQVVDCCFFKRPPRLPFARLDPGQDFYAFVHGCHRIEVELAFLDGFRHVRPQHQISHVFNREDHALLARQSLGAADIKEALNLVIDSTDGLNVTLLVDRAGDGDVLADG